MATNPPLILSYLTLLFFSFPLPTPAKDSTLSYISNPTTFLTNYQHMLTTFKIFIYPNPSVLNFTTPPLSSFRTSLLTSPFLTHDPAQAHLFFIPFPPHTTTRSLARLLQHTRVSYPFWDRSLGADHFFLSCHGVGPSSSRNMVELKKNAVMVSCFPSPSGEVIPHKDVTLPPPTTTSIADVGLVSVGSPPMRWVGYWRFDTSNKASGLIEELKDDHDFLIEYEPSDQTTYVKRLQSSKFCMFNYNKGMTGLVDALAFGCVPVLITDRPIQDLPLMDVIQWSKIALLVGSRVGHEEIKQVLNRTREGGEYENMRSSGVAAAHHLRWNQSPQSYDAFNMVMYQLWLRRHAVRYATWDVEVA